MAATHYDAGDVEVRNGVLYASGGIGKYGTGDLDVLDNIVMTSGNSILLDSSSGLTNKHSVGDDGSGNLLVQVTETGKTLTIDGESDVFIQVNSLTQVDIDSSDIYILEQMTMRSGESLYFQNTANNLSGPHRIYDDASDNLLITTTHTASDIRLNAAGTIDAESDLVMKTGGALYFEDSGALITDHVIKDDGSDNLLIQVAETGSDIIIDADNAILLHINSSPVATVSSIGILPVVATSYLGNTSGVWDFMYGGDVKVYEDIEFKEGDEATSTTDSGLAVTIDTLNTGTTAGSWTVWAMITGSSPTNPDTYSIIIAGGFYNDTSVCTLQGSITTIHNKATTSTATPTMTNSGSQIQVKIQPPNSNTTYWNCSLIYMFVPDDGQN